MFAEVIVTRYYYHGPGKGVRNTWLLQLLRALRSTSRCMQFLFVIARRRHYW